jgi:hypothetical protein
MERCALNISERQKLQLLMMGLLVSLALSMVETELFSLSVVALLQ